MKKNKNIKRIRILKKFYKENDFSKKDIELLKDAWDNLPQDISTDERVIFIEIAEKVVKNHRKTKVDPKDDQDLN